MRRYKEHPFDSEDAVAPDDGEPERSREVPGARSAGPMDVIRRALDDADRMRSLIVVGMALVAASTATGCGLLGWGCSAAQPVRDDRPRRSYIEFRVHPESAEIYIDGAYRGKVAGWKRGVVPVEPGTHRLKVTADGYITRRFDVDVGPGESRILTLEMEPKLERFSGDVGTARRRAGPVGETPSLRRRDAPDVQGR